MLKSSFFKEWKQLVIDSGNIINKIDLKGIITRDDNKVRTALIDCKIRTPEGNDIKRCVVMGKKSVVVVPMLIFADHNQICTMMVEQHRVAHGGISTEFPAGDIEDKENPANAASREIFEELNINITPTNLTQLNLEPIWVAPSYLYNPVYFFYFKKTVDDAFIKEHNLSKAGLHQEGEYITKKILPMKDVQDICTSSAIIGVKLLEKHLNRVF